MTFHFTSVVECVVCKIKNLRLQYCWNSNCAYNCAVFREKSDTSENFKALLLNMRQVRTHLVNSFRAPVIATMGTSEKFAFNILSSVATQTAKSFLWCMLLSQMFVGIKQKTKCKAVSVVLLYEINREQEIIMTHRDQTGLLGIFL